VRLAAELYDVRVGTLTGDARTFDFVPSEAGVERFGTGSAVLSVTIPLVAEPRRDHAARRRSWFAELLPEGSQYDHMLRQGGLRRGDTLGFLARYGRDVAGALQIWDLDDPTEPKTPGLAPVTASQIRRLLDDPSGAPLANDPGAGRSSLGGVQPKIVLVRTDRGWAQALGGYPTTHILKPQLDGDASTVIYDEEYGSRIARRLGLLDHSTSVEQFDGRAALVVERYDRIGGRRVHQEDFNQVLGASGDQKYQELGGQVSLRRVADVLVRHASEPDLTLLAKMVILTVAIGNLDMHAKNIGLLHPTDGQVTLAPAYDVVPHGHRSNDGRLALAVNKKYRHNEITREDLLSELSSWRMRRAAATVESTLDELDAIVASETPLDGAHPSLHEQVAGFVDNLRSGGPARERRE